MKIVVGKKYIDKEFCMLANQKNMIGYLYTEVLALTDNDTVCFQDVFSDNRMGGKHYLAISDVILKWYEYKLPPRNYPKEAV